MEGESRWECSWVCPADWRGDGEPPNALLAPAIARFDARSPEEQDEVRAALDQYVRAYSFLSQVVDFGDVGLEALSLASRALVTLLPSVGGGRLDLGSQVELTHLRLEKTSEGSITPLHGVGELTAIYSGKGKEVDEETEHLSKIVEVLNGRFGLDLGTADQLFFDQLEATWLDDKHLVGQARANPIENFRLVFNDVFIKSIVGRMDDNEASSRRFSTSRRSRPRSWITTYTASSIKHGPTRRRLAQRDGWALLQVQDDRSLAGERGTRSSRPWKAENERHLRNLARDGLHANRFGQRGRTSLTSSADRLADLERWVAEARVWLWLWREESPTSPTAWSPAGPARARARLV